MFPLYMVVVLGGIDIIIVVVMAANCVWCIDRILYHIICYIYIQDFSFIQIYVLWIEYLFYLCTMYVYK